MDFFHITEGRYRNFGIPQQFPVYDKAEIIAACNAHDRYEHCFLSTCEYEWRNGERFIYPLFYPLDFDGDGIDDENVLNDVRKTIDWLCQYELEFQVNFSGCKGYHIIIELDYPKSIYENTSAYDIYILFSRAYKNFYSMLKRKLELKTIDSHVKDVRRMLRIPGTENINCGGCCTRLLENCGKSLYILDYAPKNFDVENKPRKKKKVILESNHVSFPCLEEHIRDWHPAHNVRVNFVRLRRDQGKTINEIVNEMHSFGWEDWDEEKTRYMVAYYYDGAIPVQCNFDFCTNACFLRKEEK